MGVRNLAMDQNQALKSAKKIARIHWAVLQSTGALVTLASSEVAPFPDHHQTGRNLKNGSKWTGIHGSARVTL